ncbi:MAG: IreB family regulatory phosphoprotein [Limnochordia bacterium]|nr:IreB family regulatory phosphoprotein [Bacillota bacterium]
MDREEVTRLFGRVGREGISPRKVMTIVFEALQEKGYRPIDQIVGYLVSGDPSYITGHNQARNLIKSLERDELLEDMVRYYLGQEVVRGSGGQTDN